MNGKHMLPSEIIEEAFAKAQTDIKLEYKKGAKEREEFWYKILVMFPKILSEKEWHDVRVKIDHLCPELEQYVCRECGTIIRRKQGFELHEYDYGHHHRFCSYQCAHDWLTNYATCKEKKDA